MLKKNYYFQQNKSPKSILLEKLKFYYLSILISYFSLGKKCILYYIIPPLGFLYYTNI